MCLAFSRFWGLCYNNDYHYYNGNNMKLNCFVVGLVSLLAGSTGVQAASFILTSGNSEVEVSDRNGITVWFVEGSPDNVFISNYYYRVGEVENESVFLEGIDDTPTVNQITTEQLQLTYTGTELEAEVNYSLEGGELGSNESLLSKSVTLTNLSSENQQINLFDYSDWDIKFNQLDQRDQAIALDPGTIILNSDTRPLSILTQLTPTPSRYEINDFFTLYSKFFLDNDGATTLSNTPPLNTPFPIPASDNAMAFQWEFTLLPGESYSITSTANYTPIPEPGSIAASIILSLIFGRRCFRINSNKS